MLLVAVGALIALLAMAVGFAARLVGDEQRAQAAADAAALAGAQGGRSAAATLAARNGGHLAAFAQLGLAVEVQVVGMPDWLQASPVDVTIDCSPRPPGAGPPFCSPDSGTPDGGSDTTPDALPDDLNAGAETPLIRDSGVAWVVVEGPPPEQTGDAGGAKVASMDAQTVASMDAQTVASMDVQTVATIDAQAEVRPRSNGCGCTVGGRHGPLPRAETLPLGLILAAVGALRRRRR